MNGSKKRVLVIDGQGGRMGKLIIEGLLPYADKAELIAVGTNSLATAAMLKAGAGQAATGENAVIVACRRADIIIGPVGIVIADALLGEITPQMAVAVGSCEARRFLIPVNHCDNIIVGLDENTLGQLISAAIALVATELV